MTAAANPARAVRARRSEETAPPVAEPAPSTPVLAAIPAPLVEAPPADVDPGPRPARQPFGVRRQKLAYETRPGFHRHWFHDNPGRIPYAIECGWKHVQDKEGRNVCREVGAREGGGGMRSYLMEMPLQWYKEDQAAKLKPRDEVDAEIRRGVPIGRDGASVASGYGTPGAPGFTERKVAAQLQPDGKQFFGDRTSNPDSTGGA